MKEATFFLLPFPDSNIPEIKISGSIDRRNRVLAIHYSMTGRTENILLPPVSSHPVRRDDLWRATCFEFFTAVPEDPQYWEFNLSPSGDWNVYHMDAYRRVGFREESSIGRLPFSIHCEQEFITVDATADLNSIISANQKIEVGITCVIQSQEGRETYWALAHPGSRADFHVRESFVLRLDA